LSPASAFRSQRAFGARVAAAIENLHFVARLNVEHYRKKIAAETDAVQRQKLLRLLAEEEAKLAAIEAREKTGGASR
jgi:hypothetical protein